jgi:DNA-binding GntR family transcriptional regulator
LVDAVPRRGYMLKRPVRDRDLEPYSTLESSDDQLVERMAADRFAGRLPDQVSEADLMRRYGIARGALMRVLTHMAHDGVLERCDGHGWRFLPTLDSPQLHDESYRFRLLIEPACVLEPTFHLDSARAQRLRAQHQELLSGGLKQVSSVKFFDLNAEFHEFVAFCSGNRYLHHAIVQQNGLRRFFSYHWTYGAERMRDSCNEHIAILDQLLAGDEEQAAALLRLHLLGASRLRPRFGS